MERGHLDPSQKPFWEMNSFFFDMMEFTAEECVWHVIIKEPTKFGIQVEDVDTVVKYIKWIVQSNFNITDQDR